MTDDPHSRIKGLARACAIRGLKLHQATYLLEAMMVTDALFLERGNASAAARRLGVERASIARFIRSRKDQKDDTDPAGQTVQSAENQETHDLDSLCQHRQQREFEG